MKRIFAYAGIAIVFYALGLFTPGWIELYGHKRDLQQAADHCNKLAREKEGDAATELFRECFNQNIVGLVEIAETRAAHKAGELARKLD